MAFGGPCTARGPGTDLVLREEALQCSLLGLWGGPRGLAWWLSPALSDCSWDRSTDKLPVPQVLYLSAETEGPEEIASAATHCKMFVLCY